MAKKAMVGTMPKAEALSLLVSVSSSCQEGYDGSWDCRTDEGREGFLAMQECVDRVIEAIKTIKPEKEKRA